MDRKSKRSVGKKSKNPLPLPEQQQGRRKSTVIEILSIAKNDDLEFGIPRSYNEEEAGTSVTNPVTQARRKSLKGPQIAPENVLRPSAILMDHRKSFVQVDLLEEGAPRRKSLYQPPELIFEDHIESGLEDASINFNEVEVMQSLEILNKTNRLFIRKNKTNVKRMDLFDEMGHALYQLLDFSNPVVDTYEVNYVLMSSDGKKQLLLFQGNPGFLGLNGEITARFPGSLPGDQEMICGSVSQSTRCCSLSTKYLIHDAAHEAIYELKDQNKNCILSPFRKCSGILFEMTSPGVRFGEVFGRIEERCIVVHNDYVKGQSHLRRMSTTGRVSISENTSTSHTDFCLGFTKDLDSVSRTLMIGAHVLVNYEHIGSSRCTRYCCGMTLIILLTLLFVGVPACLTVTLANKYLNSE